MGSATPRGPAGGFHFEELRLGIERCDPDLVLDFYADDARLDIISAPQAPPFELRGKAEISKHLRAIFGQKATHRVGRGSDLGGRVRFREVCDYPDGVRVVIETTLEVRDGRILHQTDVVTKDPEPERQIPVWGTGEENHP